jgi:hypothetical protein
MPASRAAESRLTLSLYSTSPACRSVLAESAEKTPVQPSRANASFSGLVTSPTATSALSAQGLSLTGAARQGAGLEPALSKRRIAAPPTLPVAPMTRILLFARLRQEPFEGRVKAFRVLEVREVARAG